MNETTQWYIHYTLACSNLRVGKATSAIDALLSNRDPGRATFFFAGATFLFRGPNFLPGGQGIWPARENKSCPASRPLVPPRLSPGKIFFSRSAEKKVARPPTDRPQAGRAQPIRDSLEEKPQLGCQPRKKHVARPLGRPAMRKKILPGQPATGPAKKKLPGIPAAARSSTQAGQLFFAKNLAGKEFGADLGSLLRIPPGPSAASPIRAVPRATTSNWTSTDAHSHPIGWG